MGQEVKDRTHVLVVDDHKMVREGLRQLLESEFASVAVADSGEDALKKMTEQQFELVLTDTHMPGMSGIELTRHIRSQHGSRPVIIGTSISTDLNLKKAYEQAGANDFLPKGSPNLLEVLEMHLN